jgi:hypothetical protein
MLQAVGDDTAPSVLHRLLENAADRCQWTREDYEQLLVGTLPTRTSSDPTSQSVDVILNGFPRVREALDEVLKGFAIERLKKL